MIVQNFKFQTSQWFFSLGFISKIVWVYKIKVIKIVLILSIIVIFSYAYACRMNHNNTTIKDERRLLYEYICTSHFKGSKRVTQGLRVRGSWRPNRTAIYWPPLLWPSTLCLSRSPDAQPEAQQRSSLLDDGFLYCILSATSLDPNSIGSLEPLRPGGAFLTTSRLQLRPISNCLTSILSELYNSSTPTRSLESHVWSSSSGKNCHAVQRSLSSMSVTWEFFTSSHFISQFPPMRFPLITAIRMCHFLPVHHLGMAFLAGSKAKIQHYKLNKNTLHRHITLPAWISLTLSRQPSLSSIAPGRFSRLYSVSTQSSCI